VKFVKGVAHADTDLHSPVRDVVEHSEVFCESKWFLERHQGDV
jgi:hypothetical protein